jgi:hypothetical protein
MGKKPDSGQIHGCIINPFKILLLFFFILSEQKDVSVADVKSGRVLLSFRRWLTSELQTCWDMILSNVHNVELSESNDIISWKLGKNCKFSVKSLYHALTSSDAGPSHKVIWKGKALPKIKIFIWLMINNVVLTKDNLIKRKWSGNPTCQFCDHDESVDHLFFTCLIAKVVWVIIAKIIGASNVPTSLAQC